MAGHIHVYILTGFFGAGKTTLLNHLLKANQTQKNVVIENEFGAASIDGSLVFRELSDVYELNNGCICCSLDDELYDVLTLLAHAEERADNLFIETTGVADAGSVAAVFKGEDVAKVFLLQKMICVTDAETVEDYIANTQETTKQIVASDLLIINKVNLVSRDYVNKLEKSLRSLNPFADVVFSADGNIPVAHLTLAKPKRKFFSMLPKGQQQAGQQVPKALQHEIFSVTYGTFKEFDKEDLYYTLTVTLMLYYHQVYRIKGYVKLKGHNEKILVQSTGKRLTFESVGEWEEQKPLSQLVFIGMGLKETVVEKILKPALRKSESWIF